MKVTVTLELEPEQAAGLQRFAEKAGHAEAMAVLYPHVPKNVRAEQAHDILAALAELQAALTDARVRTWPWIESGRARPVERRAV
jgi:hypothetical protein